VLFCTGVVGIAVLTLIGNYIFTDIGFGQSLLRSIAV
jgi:Cu+-exporting ATPase